MSAGTDTDGDWEYIHTLLILMLFISVLCDLFVDPID